MNPDYRKSDLIENPHTVITDNAGRVKAFFFVCLFVGYIVCLPIVSLASMAATILGMMVCVIYFLILRAFARASVNRYSTYLDSLLSARHHHTLSSEDIVHYQRKINDLQGKKVFWKYMGIILFIICMLTLFGIVFIFGKNTFYIVQELNQNSFELSREVYPKTVSVLEASTSCTLGNYTVYIIPREIVIAGKNIVTADLDLFAFLKTVSASTLGITLPNLLINAGVCLMTLILCIFPAYMYQQIIDFLEVNDLRNQLKSYNY